MSNNETRLALKAKSTQFPLSFGNVRKPKVPQSSNHGPATLKTIDLFCGAGGITEGFRQAGFSCLYGNDCMEGAIQTFARNHPNAWSDPRPIEQIEPLQVRRKLGLAKGELDVLVGGPPCQGFSINAPERFLSDPRNVLFKHYARFLDEFQPRSFVFENVPGLLSLGDGRVFKQLLTLFEKSGYAVTTKILFAAQYGVPQERWRLILLGSIYEDVSHPEPTHFASGHANFRGSGALTFRLSETDQERLIPCVTVGDALDDLPRLKMGGGDEIVSYDRPAKSEYARTMRNPSGKTFNHYAAILAPQNIERMKYVRPGGSWRDIPHELLPKGMQRARKSDHTKRYGRLRKDRLAGTVLTKCDPHWGAVFMPNQERTLTVREAARLQSFPDEYQFVGNRVSQYEQVGNAVPVLMAKAIAMRLHEHLAENAYVLKGARVRYG